MKLTVLAVALFFFTAAAQEDDFRLPDTLPDSVAVDTSMKTADPLVTEQPEVSEYDTFPIENVNIDTIADTPAPGGVGRKGKKPDHNIASTSSKKEDQTTVRKIKLVKRKYNYRQQIGLAVGMMAFIAIVMTTAQTLNPK